MFSKFNVRNPFYHNFYFDYLDSDSDFDSDEDMTNADNRNTCGSKIHMALRKFIHENPINEEIYQQNQTIVQKLFECEDELWDAYNNATTQFRKDEPVKDRLEHAIEIGNAAVALRMKHPETSMTVLTRNIQKVTVTNLTADEATLISALYVLLQKKISLMTWKQ